MSIKYHHYAEFHDDIDGGTFGVLKKGIYYPASDFAFTLAGEVICKMPSGSGYLVNLAPSGSSSQDETRYSISKTDYSIRSSLHD